MTKRVENPKTTMRHEWPVDDTLVLALAIENGATMRAAGAVLGKTKDACIGKWHRLIENVSQDRLRY